MIPAVSWIAIPPRRVIFTTDPEYLVTTTRPSGGRGTRKLRVLTVVAATAVAIMLTGALSGFFPTAQPIGDGNEANEPSELATTAIIGIRTFEAPTNIRVDEDVVYGTREDGTLLTLDVCQPAPIPLGSTAAMTTPDARPAVLSIHGGSWARGDKANDDWRNVCVWLASEGFVAYSVNYRLVPDVVFPAALDDVALAVEWMRQPPNAERYAIDPARIGVFGGSAGGNLAAMLGARGHGEHDIGARVAAVAQLSAPLDLTRRGQVDGGSPAGIQRAVLEYLGCTTWAKCENDAVAASAATEADPSDPPVFIGHAEDELIPVAQAVDYAAALERAGVAYELAVAPGTEHSIGILDEPMRARVADFLRRTLAPPVPLHADADTAEAVS